MISHVGSVLFSLRGVVTALIHARLHGCRGSSCPEQNQTANPLIVNRIWQQWFWQKHL